MYPLHSAYSCMGYAFFTTFVPFLVTTRVLPKASLNTVPTGTTSPYAGASKLECAGLVWLDFSVEFALVAMSFTSSPLVYFTCNHAVRDYQKISLPQKFYVWHHILNHQLASLYRGSA